MPEVLSEIELTFYLLKRLLGVRSTGQEGGSTTRVGSLKVDEMLMINVGS
jgi:translation initiation factor 2 subunit 3